jgi:hypothetical protein
MTNKVLYRVVRSFRVKQVGHEPVLGGREERAVKGRKSSNFSATNAKKLLVYKCLDRLFVSSKKREPFGIVLLVIE